MARRYTSVNRFVCSRGSSNWSSAYAGCYNPLRAYAGRNFQSEHGAPLADDLASTGVYFVNVVYYTVTEYVEVIGTARPVAMAIEI